MESEALLFRIIQAVAREAETSPTALSPPLYESIDVDALNVLCAHSSSNVHVSFEYNGYEIHVSGDNAVSVVPTEAVA